MERRLEEVEAEGLRRALSPMLQTPPSVRNVHFSVKIFAVLRVPHSGLLISKRIHENVSEACRLLSIHIWRGSPHRSPSLSILRAFKKMFPFRARGVATQLLLLLFFFLLHNCA